MKNDAVVSLRFDRADRGWLRVSPHFYNTFAEIAKIADVFQTGTLALRFARATPSVFRRGSPVGGWESAVSLV